MNSVKLANFSPGRIVIASLLCTIVVGACLLSLPISTIHYISFVDLFFTATSLTCVTGLFTIPLVHFSFFGKCILLLLMQIGGLGIITMTLFFMYLIADLGLATQLMAGQLLEIDSWTHIKKLLTFIAIVTFSIELFGTIFLLPIFWQDHGLTDALFLAFFHSVSVFCNAGIWLIDSNTIAQYRQHLFMPIVITLLIFISDIGFMTWHEIIQYLFFSKSKKIFHFSLQSRIVFHGTLLIVGISSLLFLCIEWHNALEGASYLRKCVLSLFYSNSLRSTGLLFHDGTSLHPASLLMAMVLGFMGAAPLSTGSGVKITTIAVFLALIRSVINGRGAVEIKGRTIVIEQAHKAVAIIFLSLLWIVITTFLLLLTENSWRMNDLLFEAVMAFTNVGISTGVTPTLSTTGKLIIMSNMMIGRIGSVTLLLAILSGKKRKNADFSYPEERVTLG